MTFDHLCEDSIASDYLPERRKTCGRPASFCLFVVQQGEERGEGKAIKHIGIN